MLATLWRLVALTLLLAACVVPAQAGRQPESLLRQYLDEQTTLTLTGLREPLALYKEEPQRGVNARDYIQLAPLEINRQGDLHYYLWMCIWSTNGRAPDESVQQRFQMVYLFADGEPMELTVATWQLSEKGTEFRFYRKPVDTAVDAYYTVTADQLRRIGAAKEVYLVPSDDARGRFDTWEWNAGAMAAFADYAHDRQLR